MTPRRARSSTACWAAGRARRGAATRRGRWRGRWRGCWRGRWRGCWRGCWPTQSRTESAPIPSQCVQDAMGHAVRVLCRPRATPSEFGAHQVRTRRAPFGLVFVESWSTPEADTSEPGQLLCCRLVRTWSTPSSDTKGPIWARFCRKLMYTRSRHEGRPSSGRRCARQCWRRNNSAARAPKRARNVVHYQCHRRWISSVGRALVL